jgi:4,5:9,10-diseco-3-hydroxy-5,9,17-trioxoandrosta-1(10),2-diene-4-oate hydrolase
MPEMAAKLHVVAPDLPGAGFSKTSQQLDYRLRTVAERLLHFLDALDLREVSLLGSSHGGAVAMMAAAISPERVRRLVLVAPVNPWSQIGRRRARFFSNELIAPVFNRWAPRFKFFHGWVLRRLYGNSDRIAPGTLEGYSAPYVDAGSFTHNLKILRTWVSDLQDLKSVLPRTARIPTLLIWGTLDRAVSPASANQLKANFENARLVVFEGVGHLPYEESPQDFNRTVIDYLLQGG